MDRENIPAQSSLTQRKNVAPGEVMEAPALIIRQAGIEDIEHIAKIEARTLGLWSESLFKEELEISFSRLRVAIFRNKIIGYTVSWIVSGETELQSFAVIQGMRRKGIGERLMQDVFALSVKENSERIFLEVLEKNTAARAFYSRFGFEKIGIRTNYYKDGSAILLTCRITHEDKKRYIQ